MSEQQKQRVAFWVDLFFKVGTPIGLAALFYLKSAFVTQEQFAEAVSRINKTETAILLLTKDNETNVRQDAKLADHEQRLRGLEHRSR